MSAPMSIAQGRLILAPTLAPYSLRKVYRLSRVIILVDDLASGMAEFLGGTLAVDSSAHIIRSPVNTSTPSPSSKPGLARIVNSRFNCVRLRCPTSSCQWLIRVKQIYQYNIIPSLQARANGNSKVGASEIEISDVQKEGDRQRLGPF